MDHEDLRLTNPINDVSFQLRLLLGYPDKQYNIHDAYIDQKICYIQKDINKTLNSNAEKKYCGLLKQLRQHLKHEL